MTSKVAIGVTVWGEGLEQEKTDAKRIYPDGIHEAVAAGLRSELGDAALVRTATLDAPEHGLSAEVLEKTDVLAWWGHHAHANVDEAVADRVVQQVLDGMGLLVLHSSHLSKPFLRLMGTRCSLRWRNDAEREVVWTIAPTHAIADGVPPVFVIPEHEMYGEYFDIPPPEELVFISSFSGGEVFRSGCCWTRGKAGSSISARATRPFPSTTSQRSNVCSQTACGGRDGERLRLIRLRLRTHLPIGSRLKDEEVTTPQSARRSRQQPPARCIRR